MSVTGSNSMQPAAFASAVLASSLMVAGTAHAQATTERPGQPAASQEARQIVPTEYGVLTPRGTLVVEPSFEYQHSDVNRFVTSGAVVLDTVLVGQIEATQADRDSVTGTLTARWGIDGRHEVDFKVPVVYRNDDTVTTVTRIDDTETLSKSLDATGLGDIELGLRRQLTPSRRDAPIFIGGLRVRIPTGEGPFDVARDEAGVEEELATGSGFWGIEPNLSMLMVSDPAIYYFNVGYQWNIGEDVNEQIGNTLVEDVDPGNSIRVGFGLGIALNDQSSFNIGYSHDFVGGTEINGSETSRLSVGTLTFGVNYVLGDRTALDVGVAVGVTDDSPDVRLNVRLPMAFSLI